MVWQREGRIARSELRKIPVRFDNLLFYNLVLFIYVD